MSASEIDTQHEDVVHDTRFDYYGRFVATASSDKTVRVFATGIENTGAALAKITGHDGPVWMIDWAHPAFGVALASCSYDGKAIVWKGSEDGTAWKASHVVTSHSASVNAVAFSAPNMGLAVATASSDGNVLVTACQDGAWRDSVNVAGGDQQAHPMGALGVSFAPVPEPGTSALLASCGADASVKVWQRDSTDGKWALAQTFKEHADWVRDVAFSPDGSSKFVVLASCSQDNTVIIRRAPRTATDAWETSAPISFKDAVWRLSWSPCGTMLLVTTGDAQAFVLKQAASFGDEWVRSPVNSEEPAVASQ
jgi:protein transport protein SEC13